MSYLSIKDLTKSYGDNVILNDLNLEIESGTLNTLLGPSGCGKSTLLRSIAGLESINQGEIHINGRRVDKLSPKDRNIGMVFQNYGLFPNLTVAKNISFGLEMKKMPKSVIEKEVKEILNLVGLADKEKVYPRQLSGGQQQRVALARSLVTKPDLLLLDEPLSALDARMRINLRELIIDLQHELGITIVFVTHDQEEAMVMSDYIFVMNKGIIEQEGTPSEIYRHPKTEFIANFIGSYNVFKFEEFSQISSLDLAEEVKLVCIRPEIISLEPLEGRNITEIEGEIYDVSMRGSILRSTIRVGDQKISFDPLNRSQNFRQIGDKVRLYIDINDLILI